MFGLPDLDATDPKVMECILSANGQWASEIFSKVCAGLLRPVQMPDGVAVLSVSGDTVLVTSYSGKNLGKMLDVFKKRLQLFPHIAYVELHTDSDSVLRLWRKSGIVPQEYIARVKVNG